jgi:hypothetical protein
MSLLKFVWLAFLGMLALLIGGGLILSALVSWDQHQFKNPNFESSSEQIEREIGLTLDSPEQILLATRSSYTLQGDHIACFLVQLDETDFVSFRERIVPTENPNSIDACPAGADFTEFLQGAELDFAFHITQDGGKMISVSLQPERRLIFIKMSFWQFQTWIKLAKPRKSFHT